MKPLIIWTTLPQDQGFRRGTGLFFARAGRRGGLGAAISINTVDAAVALVLFLGDFGMPATDHTDWPAGLAHTWVTRYNRFLFLTVALREFTRNGWSSGTSRTW